MQAFWYEYRLEAPTLQAALACTLSHFTHLSGRLWPAPHEQLQRERVLSPTGPHPSPRELDTTGPIRLDAGGTLMADSRVAGASLGLSDIRTASPHPSPGPWHPPSKWRTPLGVSALHLAPYRRRLAYRLAHCNAGVGFRVAHAPQWNLNHDFLPWRTLSRAGFSCAPRDPSPDLPPWFEVKTKPPEGLLVAQLACKLLVRQ
jgi:hypothetical protein